MSTDGYQEMTFAERNQAELLETVEQAGKILCRSIERADGTVKTEDLQALVREICRNALDAAMVNDLGGCPLCQS